jgi:hypothetical protein
VTFESGAASRADAVIQHSAKTVAASRRGFARVAVAIVDAYISAMRKEQYAWEIHRLKASPAQPVSVGCKQRTKKGALKAAPSRNSRPERA